MFTYCWIYPTAAKYKKEISISFCIIKLSKVIPILKKKKEKMKKKIWHSHIVLVFQSSQFASTHFIVNRHVFPYKKQHINSECLLSEKLRCLIGEILPIQRRITIN